MFDFFKKSHNLLGLNARNLLYLRPHNLKRSIQLADNKLKAKKILKKNGLPILETYFIARHSEELKSFDLTSLPPTFTLKPNQGYGGAGVLIVYGRKKKEPYPWVKADKSLVYLEDLKSHVLNILAGGFSRTGLPDTALFEERIKLLKLFKPYAYRGIPDIRIIVHNSVPIMAEMRLPTQESDGRANLHQGGICVGIDMGTGVTTTAMQWDRLIDYVPRTRIALSGIHIPNWKEILRLSVYAQQITKIGFLGIDIAIDREKGPVILELNARPGLGIQIANLAPLGDRLQRIKGLKVKTATKGIEISKNLFGGEIEEELEEISGRRVIGINEPIEIMDKDENKHLTVAKVDTGAYRTTICKTLAEKLGLDKTIGYKKTRSATGTEERAIINLSFIMDKRLVVTEAFTADRREMKYDVIVGRRDLKRFLVDPAKNVFMGSRLRKVQKV